MLEVPSSFRMLCFRGWWFRIALKSLELKVREMKVKVLVLHSPAV